MLRDWSFRLRERVFGRIRLRRSLPGRLASESDDELWFYRRLLEPVTGALGGSALAPPDALWDVGCRDWSYARALHRAFPRARVTGIEVDLGRRYLNGFRRGDVAEARAARLRAEGVDCRVEPADVRRYLGMRLSEGERSGLAVFFFPFVSEGPCRAWGLPARFARFEEWLAPVARARGSVGAFSVHQGEWEAAEAAHAYQAAGIATLAGRIPSSEWEGRWPLEWDAHWFLSLPARTGEGNL